MESVETEEDVSHSVSQGQLKANTAPGLLIPDVGGAVELMQTSAEPRLAAAPSWLR